VYLAGIVRDWTTTRKAGERGPWTEVTLNAINIERHSSENERRAENRERIDGIKAPHQTTFSNANADLQGAGDAVCYGACLGSAARSPHASIANYSVGSDKEANVEKAAMSWPPAHPRSFVIRSDGRQSFHRRSSTPSSSFF
jgi:hypothetical protein